MKVEILLTLDVEDCAGGFTSANDKKRLAAEAIHNAVQAGEQSGHNHEREDTMSIMLKKVEVFHVDGFRLPMNLPG